MNLWPLIFLMDLRKRETPFPVGKGKRVVGVGYLDAAEDLWHTIMYDSSFALFPVANDLFDRIGITRTRSKMHLNLGT